MYATANKQALRISKKAFTVALQKSIANCYHINGEQIVNSWLTIYSTISTTQFWEKKLKIKPCCRAS